MVPSQSHIHDVQNQAWLFFPSLVHGYHQLTAEPQTTQKGLIRYFNSQKLKEKEHMYFEE